MKLSPSIEIVMSLATREALAAGFPEIEPEHILMAILKFVEVDVDPLEAGMGDSGFRGFLRSEQDDVKNHLQQRGLDSATARRRLRKGMGTGPGAPRAGVMHRSAEAKRRFALAERTARRRHAGFLTVTHLLQALLDDLTPVMLEAVADLPGAATPGSASVSTAADGIVQRDLSRREIATPCTICGLQVRSLERHLEHAPGRPLLLVAENDALLSAFLDRLAGEKGRPDAPLAGERMVELACIGRAEGGGNALAEQLNRVITAAARKGVGLLVITGQAFTGSADDDADLLTRLGNGLRKLEQPLKLLAHVPAPVFAALQQHDPATLRHCHVIHLLPDDDIQAPDRLDGRRVRQPADPAGLLVQPFFTARSKPLVDELCTTPRDPRHPLNGWLAAAHAVTELAAALAGLAGLSTAALRKRFPDGAVPGEEPELTEPERKMLERAADLARERPDNGEPGLVDILHLAAALLLSPAVCETLGVPAPGRQQLLDALERLYAKALASPRMEDLTGELMTLRERLRTRVFGQDHAIHAFVEALFNAELVAAADTDRRRPKALLVFAGPPGVGKTFLAETGAQALGRPFKRFDMSAFSDHQAGASLIGFHPSYQSAQPGLLTGFVKQHPGAVLLFDEIEKAHLNTLQLFLQLLDAGTLEDKNTEEAVAFRDTLIIFTTNAGKSLYQSPNATGIQAAHSGYHRKTILGALETEQDPRTGKPMFPAALCSRIATGYPILFNHLGIAELSRVAGGELERQGRLLEEQYGKEVEYDPALPLCLVLREGGNTDARTVRAQAETFVKEEIFRFSQLYRPERLQEVLAGSETFRFELDPGGKPDAEASALLRPNPRPKVLLVADPELGLLFSARLPEIEWELASDLPDALNAAASGHPDLVLLDLWLRTSGSATAGHGATMVQFDFLPAAARGIARGREILHQLHQQRPELPCFLLSRIPLHTGAPAAVVDGELLMACVQSGGARGVIEARFPDSTAAEWDEGRAALHRSLVESAGRVHMEARARTLAAERKALTFETAPQVDPAERVIRIRLRNLRLGRALAAEDVSEVLDEVERPTIGFADVFGADAAKGELEFIVDWLTAPQRYRDMGLRPPRGILLYGPPGTGKTLLARALAGESKAGFLVAAASGFVTIWQGSGPENVRKLFERARRYAPSILFIDEIDAIGKRRMGGAGASAAAEQTLNALLTEMDGFATTADRPVIVLAATNLVESLDEALRRRFDREIEVDRPDRAGRAGYLRLRLQGSERRQVSDGVLERLAGQSAGLTIADLERVVALAGRLAARGDGVIDDGLAEEAFERMRMGEAKSRPDPATLLRIARHEAGHCLIGWLAGSRPVQITIMGRGNAGGFVEREAEEERMLYTKPELETLIRQCLGGRAAEILYYGAEEGLASGAANDLRVATRYAQQMVRNYGMDAGIGPVALDPQRLGDGPLALELMRAAANIIGAQQQRALEELKAHRQALDVLVDALMERNRLTREELEALWNGSLTED